MTPSNERQAVTPLPEAQDVAAHERLAGRIAIVTGADSGIGRGTAIELARAGADVAVTYHSDEDGASGTLGEVEGLGRRGLVVKLDQRDPQSVAALFRSVHERLGAPFILVNNAAVSGPEKPVADTDPQEWDEAIRTILSGPFYCAREFIRARRADGGGGKLINVTSVHEEIPMLHTAAYNAAKGGLRNLTRSLALEVASDGINVNNIAPGMILTPMNQQAMDDEAQYRRQVQHIPLRRAGLPWEVGRLTVYLASADADYVHGTTITIDGGLGQMMGQGA